MEVKKKLTLTALAPKSSVPSLIKLEVLVVTGAKASINASKSFLDW